MILMVNKKITLDETKTFFNICTQRNKQEFEVAVHQVSGAQRLDSVCPRPYMQKQTNCLVF